MPQYKEPDKTERHCAARFGISTPARAAACSEMVVVARADYKVRNNERKPARADVASADVFRAQTAGLEPPRHWGLRRHRAAVSAARGRDLRLCDVGRPQVGAHDDRLCNVGQTEHNRGVVRERLAQPRFLRPVVHAPLHREDLAARPRVAEVEDVVAAAARLVEAELPVPQARTHDRRDVLARALPGLPEPGCARVDVADLSCVAARPSVPGAQNLDAARRPRDARRGRRARARALRPQLGRDARCRSLRHPARCRGGGWCGIFRTLDEARAVEDLYVLDVMIPGRGRRRHDTDDRWRHDVDDRGRDRGSHDVYDRRGSHDVYDRRGSHDVDDRERGAMGHHDVASRDVAVPPREHFAALLRPRNKRAGLFDPQRAAGAGDHLGDVPRESKLVLEGRTVVPDRRLREGLLLHGIVHGGFHLFPTTVDAALEEGWSNNARWPPLIIVGHHFKLNARYWLKRARSHAYGHLRSRPSPAGHVHQNEKIYEPSFRSRAACLAARKSSSPVAAP